jgi:RES domain-containing protein
MIVYRLLNNKYGSALSGKGAKIAGGRWNSPEIEMIYTSESRSLCTAEVAVNLPMGILPKGYEMITLNIPDEMNITEMNEDMLPLGWESSPFTTLTQRFGDRFIYENKFPVMKVPSAVVPGDFNYLINPRHPDFNKIEIIKKEPYEFDERLFKR